MKIIILEGCDKAGKSSFLKLLHASLGGTIVSEHYGVPKCDAKELAEDYVADLNHAKKIGVDYYILDRSYFGNLIYSKLYDQTTLSDAQAFSLHQYFSGCAERIYYVLLTAPAVVIQKRFRADKEDLTSEKHIPKILHAYNKQYLFVKECFPKTIRYRIDSSKISLNQMPANVHF